MRPALLYDWNMLLDRCRTMFHIVLRSRQLNGIKRGNEVAIIYLILPR